MSVTFASDRGRIARHVGALALVAALLPLATTLGGCQEATSPDGSGPPPVPPGDADLVIDASADRQTMTGFGATTLDLVYGYGAQDNLPPSLRQEAIEAAYGRVGLDMGNLAIGNIETSNDDDDPFTFNLQGFRFDGVLAMQEKLVDLASAHGFSLPYPGYQANIRWTLSWLQPIRNEDYDRYLDEVGEYVAAGVIDWQMRFGEPPRYAKIFNEPLDGNRELAGGSEAEVADLVARVGDRLELEGFGDVKFLVPSGTTEEGALRMAETVLADPDAAEHVGVLAYHPYRGPYNRIADILATSGQGRPDAGAVAVREQIRSLAEQHGIEVWMTEVSGGRAGAASMDALRGRAIHVHDELEYAGASAYFTMNNIWDSRSHRDHFGNDDLLSEEDTIVLIDLETGEVMITSAGHAVGHYARWVEPGAVRVETTSRDDLVQVSAFRDDARRRLSAVLVNNHPEQITVDVAIQGLELSGTLVGEYSAGDARWEQLGPIEVGGGTSFEITLPAHSVVSVGGAF